MLLLSGVASVASTVLPWHTVLLRGKCHIKQLKNRKIHKTCLINHTHIHTHAHTHIPICKQRQFQKTGMHQPSAEAPPGLRISNRAMWCQMRPLYTHNATKCNITSLFSLVVISSTVAAYTNQSVQCKDHLSSHGYLTGLRNKLSKSSTVSSVHTSKSK